MSLYPGARMRPLSDRGEGASVVSPPLIDRSKVAASLLLRCDHSASISIDVTGVPFPQVTWYLDSRPIIDSPEFRVARDADGRKHTLIVAKVTEDLESGLRVKAVSCAGQDQWAFDIKTYKLFSGRSQSDGMKISTLPLHQPTGRRKGSATDRSPKSLRNKKQKRFELTRDEYDRWQQEMERRSHMRSIDDILDNFSDDDPDAASLPTQNETKSEDNYAMETRPPSSTVADSFAQPPSPIGQATVGSFQEQCSLGSRASDVAFPPARADMSSLVRDETPCVTPGVKTTNEARDTRDLLPKNDIPLWEMFGVKLSEFCRTILASNAGASVNRQNHHGIRGSAIQTRNDIVSETSRPSKPQSRSVPVERKALGPRLVKNQVKPVCPERNTRIPISKERCGQQEHLLSGDPTHGMTQMSDGVGYPNLRPVIPPKGEATQMVPNRGGSSNLRPTTAPNPRVTHQMSDGGGSPNLRPPLAPKPSSIEKRQMRGTTGVKDQVPTNLDASGSLRTDSLAASQPSHRTGAETSNCDARVPPKAQTSQATRPTVLDSSEPRSRTWEKGVLVQGSSSLDRGQNLLQWGPAVDQLSAEVRGEERRRLEIKTPTTTRMPSGGILETHFNEPLSETAPAQKIPDTFIANQTPASESFAVEKAEVVKADMTASTGSDVIRKKPPIAKDKPFWNPATGAKGRGIPRANPTLPLKAEQVEVGSKQKSGLQPNSGPQSTPSKPTLVRRARSQSSGRSEEMTTSGEEEASGYPFGATSAVQLSCSQELVAGNPTQGAEQLPQSGLGRFQNLAAKSEGLLTMRKRNVSPTGAGAVDQNGGCGREWHGRMPISKSVDLLDAARNMVALQRIGRRSLSKEWQVVTVTTKEEITILHRPVTCVRSPTATTTAATTLNKGLMSRPQLRSSKPYAV